MLLPVIGLNPMLIVAAVVDIGIGVLLLHKAGAGTPEVRYLVPAALGIAAVFMALIAGSGAASTRTLLASGVYRTGEMLQPERPGHAVLPRRPHRHRHRHQNQTGNGWLTLATNGKPDASLTTDVVQPCSSTTAPVPHALDAGPRPCSLSSRWPTRPRPRPRR